MQGEWSEAELEQLKAVFAELKESVETAELAKSVANHFPHRRITDVTNQLREEGLLALPRRGGVDRGRGNAAEDTGEKRQSSTWGLVVQWSLCILVTL